MKMNTALHKIDRARIWSMLQAIPAHNRGDWIIIGMALKAEFGDSGYSLFDEWSQQVNNYDPKSVVSVWRSFRGGAVSIGSLVHLAKDHGWCSDSTKHAPIPKPRKAPPRTQNNTKSYALRLWVAANSDDGIVATHPYSTIKGVTHAAGAARGNASGKILGKNADCIIVPIRNMQTNKIQGVQCINREGRKQTFGQVSGGALILGNTLNKSIPWYVCEGWASTVSMVFHHHKGNAVCATSFGKHNQKKVANLIAETHRPDEIIILKEVDL